MLSIFADAMRTASRQDRWAAPDHWKHDRAPRSNVTLEREAAERRYHAYLDAGLR